MKEQRINFNEITACGELMKNIASGVTQMVNLYILAWNS